MPGVVLLAGHVLAAVLTGLAGPRAFLVYHACFAAVYASGLADAAGGFTLLLGGTPVGVTGLLWLASFLLMLPVLVLHWRIPARPLSPLTRRYGLALFVIGILHLLTGGAGPGAALHGLELLYPFGVLLLCHAAGDGEAARRALLRGLLGFGVLLVLLLPLNLLLLGGHEGSGMAYARVMSTALLPTLCLLLALGLRSDGRWLAGALALFAVPLFSVSRGVTLAVAIALAAFLLTRAFGRGGLRAGAVAVLLAAITAGTAAVWPRFAERTFDADVVNPAEVFGVNTSGRLALWLRFAGELEEAPPQRILLGAGLGAADELVLEGDPSGWFRHPHSEFLRFLVNSGVVGLLAYYAILLALPRRRGGGEEPGDETGLVLRDAALLLAVAMLVLSLYENFLLYNPFGFTQNAFLLFALAVWFPRRDSVSSPA